MRTSQIVGGAAALLVAAGGFVAFADTGNHIDRSQSARVANGVSNRGPAPRISDTVLGARGSAPNAFDAAKSAEAVPSPAAGRGSVAPAGARVVKTAAITLSVGRNAVTRVADAVGHAAERQGGYVSETERDTGDAQSATLTVRVPASNYDAALSALRKLGRVQNESLGGKDVTGTLVDLDARLRSLRAQEQALNALMAKANTVGETLQVAQSVGAVRTQIEQLTAQQNQLGDQADFATISVNVLGPNAAIDPTPKPEPLLIHSIKRAGAGALAVFGGVIVVLGFVLPTALLAAVAFGIWRVINRRRVQPA